MNVPKGIVIRPALAKAAWGRGNPNNKRSPKSSQNEDDYGRRTASSSGRSCDIMTIIAYLVLLMCVSIFSVTFYSYMTEHDVALPHPAFADQLKLTGLLRRPPSPAAVVPPQKTSLPPSHAKEDAEEEEDDDDDEPEDAAGTSKSQSGETQPSGKERSKSGKRDPLAPLDNGPEPHIQFIHGEKDGTIKQDMRVVLFDSEVAELSAKTRQHGTDSKGAGAPNAYKVAVERLKALPLFTYQSQTPQSSLEATMEYLSALPQCNQKPIFLSMASVGDELYWQLIENFVYTMTKFNTVECSLVICVSDANCMKMCANLHFPCYDFKSAVRPLPSVMEQIGEVKLYHVPKALEKGVDVFMLDLDVGFLNDPMSMVRAFYATPKIDIMVQEDMIFIMNRSKAGWKTWFTQPLPNIGLFLCRGNEKTKKVFDIAWSKYIKMEDIQSKSNPGKDQNHVLEAMRIGRGTFGLRYAYFSNDTALLLDKVVLKVDRSVELGGEASGNLLTRHHTLASHTTCYEHTTKVLGLKATNAFWNPLYYDPLRPTITKQIVYTSELQVLDEVRTLLWLGVVTRRAVIIPNILGREDMAKAHTFGGQVFWPGFRVAKIKRDHGIPAFKVDILEPAFYWRVQRDYDDAPEPSVLHIKSGQSAQDVRDVILALGADSPRLVLNVPSSSHSSRLEKDTERLSKWAKDSVGLFELPYREELRRYNRLPSIKDVSRTYPQVESLIGGLRLCDDIFTPHKGNRTCFQICE
jgi:hypothetical protein